MLNHILSRLYAVKMTCAVEALTLITWLRQCLSGLSVVNFFPLPTPYLLERSHYMQPTLEDWGVMHPLCEGGVAAWIIWNPSAQIDLSSPVCLTVWTCGHLFYTLGWMQYHLIYCFAQIVPSLAAGSSFLWLLCPFYILPSLWDLDFFFLLF